jgi:hypothetical protein
VIRDVDAPDGNDIALDDVKASASGPSPWAHVETERRLWDGVFDSDLDVFSSGGPDNSPRRRSSRSFRPGLSR